MSLLTPAASRILDGRINEGPATLILMRSPPRKTCVPVQVLGSIDGSGRIRLVDPEAPPGTPTPVDLDLETVLGSMPNKTFRFDRKPLQSRPLDLPQVRAWLRLTSVHVFAAAACLRPSYCRA